MKTGLLLLLLAFASPAQMGSDDASVLAVYDLRPVTPRFDRSSSWRHSLVLPPADPYGEEETARLQDLHEDGDAADVVVELVGQILGEELRRPDRSVGLDGDSRLFVLAPEAIQARVRAALDALERALSAHALLEMDVLTLEGPWEDSGPCVQDAAEAERMVEALLARGASHRRLSVRLSAGRTSGVDLMSRIPFLYDYDVEIAQGSVIWDPVVLDAAAGTRLLVRGVPVTEGLALSLVFQDAQPLDEVIEKPLEVSGSVAHEKDGITYVQGPKVLQSIEVLARSFAFDTLLPRGRALVLASHADLGGRASYQVVVLRQTGGELLPYHEARIPGTAQRLVLLNTELLSPPRMRAGGPREDRSSPQHPHLWTRLLAEPSLFLFDWMKSSFSIWRRLGPWVVAITDPDWDGDAPDRLQALFDRGSPSTSWVELDATLVSRRDGGASPVRWRVPVRPGSRAGALVGVTSPLLRDFDVEVAQFAAGPDPELRASFDGLALAFEPSGDAHTLTLDVRALAWLRTGPVERVAISDPRIGHVERVEYDRFEVDERLRLERTDGVTLVSLGDAGVQGEEPSLRLELRVR